MSITSDSDSSQHDMIGGMSGKKKQNNIIICFFFFLYTIFNKTLFNYFEGIWKESFGSHSQSSHSERQQWKAMRDHLGVWLTSQTTFCWAADTQERTRKNKGRKGKQWGRSFNRQTWIKHTRRCRFFVLKTTINNTEEKAQWFASIVPVYDKFNKKKMIITIKTMKENQFQTSKII